MRSIIITGCWEGALLSEKSGLAVPFSLQQPAQPPLTAPGPRLAIGDTVAARARVLDGAAHSIVALVDGGRDPATGVSEQWLVDARVHGTHMEGRWVHRDVEGHVLGTGYLTAEKIANG